VSRDCNRRRPGKSGGCATVVLRIRSRKNLRQTRSTSPPSKHILQRNGPQIVTLLTLGNNSERSTTLCVLESILATTCSHYSFQPFRPTNPATRSNAKEALGAWPTFNADPHKYASGLILAHPAAGSVNLDRSPEYLSQSEKTRWLPAAWRM
jgi:hypothetical protein